MTHTHTETYYIHELLKNKIYLFIYYYFFKKIKIVRFQNIPSVLHFIIAIN